MNDLDLYHFLYSNYLAEEELLDAMSVGNIKLSYMTESTEIINEALGQALMDMLHKIISNIQAVWNKFKSTLLSEADKAMLKQNAQYYMTNYRMTVPIDFDMPVIKNFGPIEAVTIPRFTNDDSFLASLDDEKAFKQKYFAALIDAKDDKKSMQAVAKDSVTEKSTADTVVNPAMVKDYIAYLNNYQSTYTKISDDVKMINDAINTIETKVGVANESTIYEADEQPSAPAPQTTANNSTPTTNNTTTNQTQKQSFGNADQTTDSEGQKQAADATAKYNLRVKTYISVCTQALSAKLAAASILRKSCSKLLGEYAKCQIAENGGNKTTAKIKNAMQAAKKPAPTQNSVQI